MKPVYAIVPAVGVKAWVFYLMEENELLVEQHDVLAWEILSGEGIGKAFAEPVLIESVPDNGLLMIERPDGWLVIPEEQSFPSMENAKSVAKERLMIREADAAAKRKAKQP